MEAEEVAKLAEDFLNKYERLMETQDSYGLFTAGNALKKAIRKWKDAKVDPCA